MEGKRRYNSAHLAAICAGSGSCRAGALHCQRARRAVRHISEARGSLFHFLPRVSAHQARLGQRARRGGQGDPGTLCNVGKACGKFVHGSA